MPKTSSRNSLDKDETEKIRAPKREEKEASFERFHGQPFREAKDKAFTFAEDEVEELCVTMLEEEDRDFDPAHEKSLRPAVRESFSLDYVCRVLDYVEKHPTHSMKTIKGRFTRVRHQSYLARFRKYREKYGTKRERYVEVARFCREMCEETEASGGIVDNEKLRAWALQKAEELHLSNFSASPTWLARLKKDLFIAH